MNLLWPMVVAVLVIHFTLPENYHEPIFVVLLVIQFILYSRLRERNVEPENRYTNDR